MSSSVSILLVSFAVFLAIPVTVFFAEIIAAVALPNRDDSVCSTKYPRPRVAVLVPAHNESTGLLATLRDIRAQLRAGDQLLVVADNCSDDTAAVAAAAGAEVIERNEPNKRGKGYALAWGVNHLARDPPDVVMIVDADCRVPDTAVETLTTTCAAMDRPVQALSSMVASDDSTISTRVAEFAWCVKNYVRPRGLCNLGLPCQIMGTGVAFPWHIIRAADLASGAIVEDLKLGLELALAGHAAVFCPFPGVVSKFPSTDEGIRNQRQRWEQGQMSTFRRLGPYLIFVAVARRNLDLLALALDLSVPPLSLLGILVVGMFVATSVATLVGTSFTATAISLASLIAFTTAVVISWLKYGRSILPAKSIILIFPYVFRKLILYHNILRSKSSSQWIRADRTKNPKE